jgi:mRNA turnover protein 4
MRNAHLKTVRRLWKEYVQRKLYSLVGDLIMLRSSARLFFGRGAVMAKALGTTTEEEHRPGLSKLSSVSEKASAVSKHCVMISYSK